VFRSTLIGKGRHPQALLLKSPAPERRWAWPVLTRPERAENGPDPRTGEVTMRDIEAARVGDWEFAQYASAPVCGVPWDARYSTHAHGEEAETTELCNKAPGVLDGCAAHIHGLQLSGGVSTFERDRVVGRQEDPWPKKRM